MLDKTTALAPMTQFLPITIGPIIFTPVAIIALSPIVGSS